MIRMRLFLYGNASQRDMAKGILENLDQVIRADYLYKGAELRLNTNETIQETSLIPLLRQSGIQGFRLVLED